AASLPAMILTENREKQTVIRAAALGVRDYVLKSNYSAERLLAKVKQLLESVQKTGGEAPAKTMPATDREAAGGLKLSPAGKPKAEKPVTTAIPPSQSWPR